MSRPYFTRRNPDDRLAIRDMGIRRGPADELARQAPALERARSRRARRHTLRFPWPWRIGR